jgi:hypothetical protein
MSQPNKIKPNLDDLLADFTDRVLDGKTSILASPADNELRGLEETILRLHQTLPQEAVTEKTLRHLQANFKVRVREASTSSRPVWQSRQTRQRLFLAFTAIVILAAIFVAFPFLESSNSLVQGTAGLQPEWAILLVAVGCVIVLLIWLGRRK